MNKEKREEHKREMLDEDPKVKSHTRSGMVLKRLARYILVAFCLIPNMLITHIKIIIFKVVERNSILKVVGRGT